MKKLPFVSLLVGLVAAACGGSIGVDPITGGPGTGPGDANGGTTPTQTNDEPAPDPVAPTTPYTGDVGTNDVSILYPMPAAGESKDFVRPIASGTHGELLPKMDFEKVVPNDRLERTDSTHPSGYGELALIGVRLDHCSTF
jgi:hypothetical protein